MKDLGAKPRSFGLDLGREGWPEEVLAEGRM